MENEKIERALAVFKTLCKTLDDGEWPYEKNDEKLSISTSARGDDLPMDINIVVDAERQAIVLFSNLSFAIPEDKRLDFAIAISAINNLLVGGNFDFDISSGSLYFRMTNCFIDSEIGCGLFDYMMKASCFIIDDYNDKLLMLAKGLVSIEDFISKM